VYEVLIQIEGNINGAQFKTSNIIQLDLSHDIEVATIMVLLGFTSVAGIIFYKATIKNNGKSQKPKKGKFVKSLENL